MKKSYLIAFFIAVIAVLWVGSGVLSSAPDDGHAGVHHTGEKEVPQVRVREFTAEPMVKDVIVTGRTQASRKVVLKAETEGLVTELTAEKGARVDEGTVLARLEARDRAARRDEARERVKQREIEYNAAKSLESRGFNSRIKLAQARADLEAAKAALKQAEVDLANIEITAPFDGIVNGQFIEAGDYVGKGDDVLSIVDLDPVVFCVFFTEQQVADLTVGGPAKATLVNGTELVGKLTYVSPVADQQTRTFLVEIEVPNTDMKIVEGLTARINIPLQERQAHKISPSILTLNDEGQVGVKIVDDEDHVRFKPISIISDSADYMWIGGLPETVRIITVGQDFVVDGQLVKAVPAHGDGLL